MFKKPSISAQIYFIHITEDSIVQGAISTIVVKKEGFLTHQCPAMRGISGIDFPLPVPFFEAKQIAPLTPFHPPQHQGTLNTKSSGHTSTGSYYSRAGTVVKGNQMAWWLAPPEKLLARMPG